ncbi:MAG: peptide-methionine (S)-S-oxide reductase MsrA [Mariniphaga sp.]|nr:peptide-methionine (S)-S-oxide reductase MsrA [Mariniphaga sp.]MDD4226754.1 peptide-methionine (S)-S-oxide reductase MsrA [Mariniphaga sp.]
MSTNQMEKSKLETATLGGGCFWCTEAVYKKLNGVKEVVPGYSGGHTKDPSYQEVCTGNTGHAEVIRITFHPDEISFEKILEVFFAMHDPTTLNRQGNDIGTQYRSVIFFHSEEQKRIAGQIIRSLETEKIYSDPVVTEVAPFEVFYSAEDYHHNYFERNKNQSYCRFVIAPKVEKFRKIFLTTP